MKGSFSQGLNPCHALDYIQCLRLTMTGSEALVKTGSAGLSLTLEYDPHRLRVCAEMECDPHCYSVCAGSGGE